MMSPGSIVLRTSSIYYLLGRTLGLKSGKYFRIFDEFYMVLIEFHILSVENSIKLGALTTCLTIFNGRRCFSSFNTYAINILDISLKGGQ